MVHPLPSSLLDDHSAAIDEFAARVSAIPTDRWNVPRAPGKWTPAQETKHLVLAFEAFLRDLRGEGSMRLKGKWWQRRLWRLLALRKILVRGRVPAGASAPREIRPGENPGDQATLVAELRARATEFSAALRDAAERDPRRRVTHPYFNGLTLKQVVRFSAVHVRHHTANFPPAR